MNFKDMPDYNFSAYEHFYPSLNRKSCNRATSLERLKFPKSCFSIAVNPSVIYSK